ncbi:peptidylprolyl isomerase [Asticcacaulis tiandongensis]|uniref:peptidylprolyl isomerase n=1 Tax=Asticcacaulis tiandongensis TaxID=2565365 RepID=UPI001FE5083B|nr:peptidylprolyl isomerase [Asticcacaulis tiandongensis]
MMIKTIKNIAPSSYRKAGLRAGVAALLLSCSFGIPAATAQQSPVATQPVIGEGIIATVNDRLISSYDLRQRMLLLIVTSGVQVTQQNYQSFQQQALRNLIDERLELQEMERWELEVTDAEIDEEIARMAAQSGLTSAQLLEELQRVGVEPQTLRSQIKAEVGWNYLVNGRFRSKARVSKEQVDLFMARLTEESQKPQYLVAEIYLDPTLLDGGMAEAEAGAAQLFDQIVQGAAPFMSVARQFSHAPSAAEGGDAGWLVSGTIDPRIETTLQNMTPGQLTRPIVTEDGVYIYYLREKSEGNADTKVRLRQAAITLPADADASAVQAAQRALTAYKQRNTSCDKLENSGQIRISDLGETPLSDLRDDYAETLRPLRAGQVTEPMRNDLNMNVLYVCDKTLAGDNAPTRAQIEDKLMADKVAMLGRRYLRDIRAGATIEVR